METPADKPTTTRKRQRKQTAGKTVKKKERAEGEHSKHQTVGRGSVKRKYTKKKKKEKLAGETAKSRNLNKEERIKVQTNSNREEVILYVYKAVPECLVPDLFPQRLILWRQYKVL